MYVLGIETSCDETAASVVEDGRRILSNEVSSSLRFHKKYGGVVPEIASRMQLETITAVVDCALKKARVKLENVNLVSVTSGPGLLGSLLVGISFAKSLGLSLKIPLLGVNHLYSHIYANFLNPGNAPLLPFVALVISGGHTSLFYVEDFDRIKVLGQTLDDACGEAFDKVAKILGLGYPGGPLIERLGKKGNPRRIRFNCSDTRNPLDFSFSGIKTAVLYYVRRFAGSPVRRSKNWQTGKSRMKQIYGETLRDPEAMPEKLLHSGLANWQTRDIAASFQEAVIDALIKKSLLACRIKKTKILVAGGGVGANNRLRERFYAEAKNKGIRCYFPAKELCLDNAAMVAGLGYRLFKRGYRSDLNLNAELN